jgi:hypothetical protein
MFPSSYFSKAYFSPNYFSSTMSAQGVPTAPTGYRDRDAFEAIKTVLSATGEFAAVVFGTPADDLAAGADQIPMAIITPNEWEEVDDVDPIVGVRHVSYTLTLATRDEDPQTRFEQLDRLTSIAQNTLDGTDLNGGCVPALTRLRRGRFETKPRHPEQRVILSGEFSYLISTYSGHDTTE